MAGVLLINPKFATNVGGALRACAAFGAETLYWTGTRVRMPAEARALKKYARLPREVRMHSYRETVEFKWLSDTGELELWQTRQPYDFTPVAVEFRDSYEQLPQFEHPERALYVFGAEDGSIPVRPYHRFLTIPTEHCLNLAAAVNVVLYDRMAKRTAESRPEPR